MLVEAPLFTYATVLTGRTRRVALDISSLGKGLAKCQQLQNLKFDFAGCRELTDISSLCKGLAKCQQLQNLDFDFANCTKLKDISSLGEGVAKCRDWICDRAFRCHALFLDWEDAGQCRVEFHVRKGKVDIYHKFVEEFERLCSILF